MRQEYYITLHSQLGPRDGTLSIAANGSLLSGTLTLLGFENPVTGRMEGDGTVILSHPLQTAIDSYPCRSVFSSWGATLQGIVYLGTCSMRWSGVRRGRAGTSEECRE